MNSMNTKIFLLYSLLAVMILGFSSCQSQEVKVEKGVHGWYVCHDNTSFDELAPYAKMLKSMSVFGKPSKEFIDQCHTHGIDVYHAVSGTEKNISTDEQMNKVTDGYVNYCIEHNYDGIDLDFEHLDASFQSRYSEFLRMASDKLHKEGKKLNHCVAYYADVYDDESKPMFMDAKVIAETCDLVRVMCYDMYWGPGVSREDLVNRVDCIGMGPTSNYPWTKQVMQYWMKYVPNDKLVMALPAYGNDYVVSTDQMTGRQVYSVIPDAVQGQTLKPVWNFTDKLNVYHYTGKDGHKHIFFASDEHSTKELLKLADELNLPYVGFWHFSTVTPEMWSVTEKWIAE